MLAEVLEERGECVEALALYGQAERTLVAVRRQKGGGDRALLLQIRDHIAALHLRLARAALGGGKPGPTADAEFRAAIEVLEGQVKDGHGDPFRLGEVEVELAEYLKAGGDRPGALEEIRKGAAAMEIALATGQGDRHRLGRVLATWGRWVVEGGDDSAALPVLKRAAETLEEGVRRRPRDERFEYGRICRDLARLHGRAGRAIEERNWFLKAVEAMEPVVKACGGSPFEFGETCHALAWTYHREYKPWAEAIRWTEKAIQHKEDALGRGEGDPVSLGDSREALGWILHHTRKPGKALTWFEKSVDVKRLALAHGRGSRNSLAYAYRAVGWGHQGANRPEQATEWLLKAHGEFRAESAAGTPDWPGLVLVARELAEWFQARRQETDALLWFGRAIDHQNSAIRAGSDDHRSLARLHFARGRLHLSRNNDGYALADFHHAMDAEKKWAAMGRAKGFFLGEIEREVARSFASERNWKKSLKWYERAASSQGAALAAGEGDATDAATTCQETADVCIELGLQPEAEAWRARAEQKRLIRVKRTFPSLVP